MNQLEQYMVELLQDNITYQGKNIPLVKNFKDKPSLPVITINDMSINTLRVDRQIIEETKAIYQREITMQLNLWCNKEHERQQISHDILHLFYTEQNQPLPEGEQSMTTRHGILHGSLNIEPPFAMDEVDQSPPLLRDVFMVQCIAEEKINVGDEKIQHINHMEDVI